MLLCLHVHCMFPSILFINFSAHLYPHYIIMDKGLLMTGGGGGGGGG